MSSPRPKTARRRDRQRRRPDADRALGLAVLDGVIHEQDLVAVGILEAGGGLPDVRDRLRRPVELHGLRLERLARVVDALDLDDELHARLARLDVDARAVVADAVATQVHLVHPEDLGKPERLRVELRRLVEIAHSDADGVDLFDVEHRGPLPLVWARRLSPTFTYVVAT